MAHANTKGSRIESTPSAIHFSENILLVGNWRSDAKYAWKMIERFWIAIAEAFPNRRKILCFPEITTVNPALAAAGIEIKEFDFDFRHPAALFHFCRRNGIGLIYLTDRPYRAPLYPLLKAAGVHKIIVHDHTPGRRTEPSGPKRLAKKTAIRLFGADAYIACSEYVLDRFTKACCIPPKRCYLAENGIDLSKFPHPHPTIRHELSLSQTTRLVVSCSRVHTYKRITDIVDAAALLGDLDIHFIHIGDGPDFQMLRSRIQAHGLCERFTLLGSQHDVPRILAGCDIAVHASNGEVGLCLSILEFMASGLPVVATDEPSVSRLIEPGKTGLTYPHGNVRALADRIKLLANDQYMRKHIGSTARKKTETQYRIETTISNVVAVIKQMHPDTAKEPESHRHTD